MRRLFSRGMLVGISLIALAVPAIATATPVGAAGDCPAACVAGHYELHYNWGSEGHWHVTALDLAADHTGSFSNGATAISWSKWHGRFTMKFSVPGGHGAYVGYRNSNGGFCNGKRLGTMSNSVGNSGVWFARAASAPAEG